MAPCISNPGISNSGTSSPVDRTSLPYGTWPSPISADLVAGATLGLSDVRADGADIYWIEGRPAEAGRRVLVRWRAGVTRDMTPPPFDVGTRVHEYGGGAYTAAGGRVVFSNRADGSVWLIDGDAAPRALGGMDGLRFADFALSPDGCFVFCVREDHNTNGEAAAAIVAFDCGADADPTDNGGTALVMGPDFLASPRPSPDGRFMAWVEWDHPNMPWDATRLRAASLLQEGTDMPRLAAPWTLAGDDGTARSVIEPRWEANGNLLASSDISGWWNLYRFDVANASPAVPVAPMQAEIGLPQWIFGLRSYCPLPDGSILALAIRDGENRMLVLRDGAATPVDLHFPTQCPVALSDGMLAWLDTPPDDAASVMRGAPGQAPTVLRRAITLPMAADDIAHAQALHFPLSDAAAGTGHAFFYPPANARYCGVTGTLPPLVVMAHGGPTGRANPAFSFKVQWWTSRGFAVVDVNYGGSTGFGRPYRERLEREWGIVDIDDCIAACQHLMTQGLVDPKRIVIRGSSAGGLTVLGALARSDLFAAGTSLYGVTDLRALAQETHKFESRYLDSLIGPYPQDEDTYIARSPLTQAADIHVPVLFLHGLDDKVVPPAQADEMARALRQRGITCAQYEFEGEGHGFRKEATVRRALELELDFYRQVLGLPTAQDGEHVVLR